MSSTRLLLCLLGISATFFSNSEARSLNDKEIVGSNTAKEGQFPYHVSVQRDGSDVCGGSILSDRFILTAAHCVVREDGDFYNDSFKVIAGTSDLESTSKDKVIVDVIEAYVLKEYNTLEKKKTLTGDIAVLKLSEDLGILNNSKLAKIKLPSTDENYNGVEATISGFGADTPYNVTLFGVEVAWNRTSFNKLSYATAQVLSVNDCQEYHKGISETHLCAGVERPKKDGVCSGDSGSPLVYNGIQIGVLSFSPSGCGKYFVPARYTRISSYIDFINKVVDGETDDSIRSKRFKLTP